MFGILGGVYSAGSSVDVRLAAGGGSVGGAGSMQAEVSGDAVGRRAGTSCGELSASSRQGTKKERVRSLTQSHPLNLKWRLPTLPLSQYHRHNWA